MRQIMWSPLIAASALLAPGAGQAQDERANVSDIGSMVREIASIPGRSVGNVVRLPNDRVLLITVRDSILAYDLATKRTTLVTTGFVGDLTLSSAGDRIAYLHRADEPRVSHVWSMGIDPATGAPVGQPQRVSLSSGHDPSFSPDGRLIAFGLFRDEGKQDLAVVPSTGGAERILFSYPIPIWNSAWSGDGKSVFVRIGADSSRSIERVPVAGGQSERVMSYQRPVEYDAWIDPSLALFPAGQSQANQGRLTSVSASGARGSVKVPADASPANNMGSARTLWRTNLRPPSTYVLNLVDGSMREDYPASVGIYPSMAWSPDGRQFAFQTGDNTFELTVMSADGSGQRRYQGPLPRGTPGMLRQKIVTGGARPSVAWSPDQTTLAWRGPSGHRIISLDLASGTPTVLTRSPGVIGDFRWRPDGRSLLVLKANTTTEGEFSHSAVFEVRPDGSERQLRDLSAEYPWATVARMVSNSHVLVSDAPITRLVFVPVDGGAAREVQLPRTESGARLIGGSPSHDGKWMLLGIAAGSTLTDVVLVSTTGAPTRTVHLPFRGAILGMSLLPDQGHILVAGRTGADTTLKLFRVPIDGGTPRSYGAVPTGFSGVPGFHGMSPDGRLAVLVAWGPPNATIYELDLTPILRNTARQ